MGDLGIIASEIVEYFHEYGKHCVSFLFGHYVSLLVDIKKNASGGYRNGFLHLPLEEGIVL